ncbi:MAG TPA: plasmid pRiA4b ORF-3 family protein [Planctomycetota bacterium]|nr:plasmid pRiA4b ORF-3 family protein [Planctomycetota bacterium]
MAKSKKKTSLPMPVLKLKITLLDIHPAMWRRVLASSGMNLGDFHYLIQDATGWTNSHLHQFVIDNVAYGDPEMDEDGEFEDEHGIILAEALPKVGTRIVYQYDFGDGWEHEIELEEVLDPAPGMVVPSCIDGQRSRPPEDCGGTGGYEELLKTLAHPQHEDYEAMKEWVGDHFDPEAFDLAAINKAIKTDMTKKLTRKAMKEFFGL